MSGTADFQTSQESGNNVNTKIIVHHLDYSRSLRILWLLEELEVPYEIKEYKRKSTKQAPESLKEVHPLGKSPIITDGDLTLAESGAIIEYIIDKYGGEKSQPPEFGRIDNLYFTHYVEGSLMPLLVNKLIFTLIPQHTPFFLRFFASLICGNVIKQLIEPQLVANFNLIESHLSRTNRNWLAGGDSPTSADYMMVFAVESSRAPFIGPKTKEYVKRVHDRPAYKRALEKGGPVSME